MKKYRTGITLCIIGLFFIILASTMKTCHRQKTTIGERIPDPIEEIRK